jgi:RNA polymerase sigma-70 factor (ECF subfamily)
MTTPSLDELLELLCQGDAAAAEQVFIAYEPYLRKVVRRQLTDRLRVRFDSTDVVQSVWRDLLDGFRKAGWRFANTTQLQAFLVKVTRNRFIDRCRQHSPALDREEWLREVDPQDLPSAPQPEPSQVALANDLWERLLSLCPAEHRELLRLKRAGVPLPEIAARTGLHVGSVRRILRNLAIRFAHEQERHK